MKKVFLFAISALALFACAKNEPVVQPETPGTEVRFKANIPNTFEFKSTVLEGKQVRIVADATLDNATTVATASGNVLTPDPVIRWKLNQTDKTTFAAIFGGENVPDAPQNMEIPYSLVNEGNHDVAYHSAYLIAVADEVTPNTEVELNFAHPFSKLNVTVDNQIEGFDVKSVVVKDVITEGTIKLTDGSIELGTAMAATVASIVDNKYCAIILPQEAKLSIYITLAKEGEADQEYAFALKNAKTFEANKSYSAAITLTPATPTVGDPVSFGFEVADWAEGDSLETEGIELGNVWSVIGSWDEWQSDLPMTKNVNGEWEADITYAEGDQFQLRANASWGLHAGMKEGWTVYGIGEFDDAYLEENSGNNIILPAAGEYHLFFNPETYRFIVTATEPDPQPQPQPTTATLTLNVYNDMGWNNLMLWAWQGEGASTTNLCGEWPGLAPAATDVVVNNNTYKSFSVDVATGEAIGYLLNNNGSSQTADFSLSAISDDATVYVWLTSNATIEVIEDPTSFNPGEPQPQPTTVTLTINVYNSTNWNELKLYCWNDVSPWPDYSGAWPGMAPAATDVVVNNFTFKSFVLEGIPTDVDTVKYILNNGNGGDGNQTANLSLAAMDADTTLYVELKADLSVVVIDPYDFTPSN